MIIPRTRTIRSEELTRAAQGQACTMRLSCCSHDPETTVFAHSNKRIHGKTGAKIKAHDIFGADMCYACHAEYDARPGGYSEEFEAAMAETILRRIEQGVIRIEGYEGDPCEF